MYAFGSADCRRRYSAPTHAATASSVQEWQTGCSEHVLKANACTNRTGGVGAGSHESTQIVWMHSPAKAMWG